MLVTILLGLLVSSGAKLITPRYSPGGWVISWLLGITGALIGHLVANKTVVYSHSDATVILAALFGSVLVLYLYSFLVRKTTHHNQ